MDIVDAQVHLNMVGIDAGIAAMDAVGVNALVIDEFWGFDVHGRPEPGYEFGSGSYRPTFPTAELASTQHPERFGYIVRYLPEDPELPHLIGTLRDRPGRLALRIIPYVPAAPDRGVVPENLESARQHSAELRAGRYDSYLRLAGQHGVPVFMQLNGVGIPGDTETMAFLLEKFSNVQIVLDHVGVSLPGAPTADGTDPFAQLDDILALARYENLALKWGHAPRMSAHPYPYPDVTAALHRAAEAFGAERIMWASDYTIDLAFNSWAESLYYIRDDNQLSDSDKAWLLGGSVRRLLSWPISNGGDA